MAPVRVTRAGKASLIPKSDVLPMYGGHKRAADMSPPKNQAKKRAALGDVTNRADVDFTNLAQMKKSQVNKNPIKKAKRRSKQLTANSTDSQSSNNSSDSTHSSQETSSQESVSSQGGSTSRYSASDGHKDECSLLLSSLECPVVDSGVDSQSPDTNSLAEEGADDDDDVDIFHDTVETMSPSDSGDEDNDEADDSLLLLSTDANVAKMNARNNARNESSSKRADVTDVDVENKGDIFMVPDYAHDIFQYYKDREAMFSVSDYMSGQSDISNSMRAIVVDWIVEVQENFELNHETLYMAIRLLDLYLSKQTVAREKLQLVAATSLFIACKFEERVPPVLDDFLYVCDDAYVRGEYITMEMAVLREVNFDIGMPSSYRFLRRYAKCGRIGLETLTLARYILETSQLHYDYRCYRDSQLAAACLLLAIKMKLGADWTPTLTYYSGYGSEQLMGLVQKLNKMISLPPYKNLHTVKTKYSHKVFFEVAKIPTLNDDGFAVK